VQDHVQPHRVGDPDLPLSDTQLEAKYLELAVPVIGEIAARGLLQRVWSLDSARDLDFTMRLT